MHFILNDQVFLIIHLSYNKFILYFSYDRVIGGQMMHSMHGGQHGMVNMMAGPPMMMQGMYMYVRIFVCII